MSVVAGVRYVLDQAAGQWVAPGRASLPGTVEVDRDGLVPGSYVPGLVADTVGARLDRVVSVERGTVQPLSNGAYSAFPRYILAGAGEIVGTRFECPVFTSADTTGDWTFRHCHFVGWNPQLVQAAYDTLGATTAVAESASGVVNYRSAHLTFIDCTWDNGWWYDQGLSDRISTLWSAGLHGGGFTVTRGLIRRFTDGVNWAQGPCGADAFTLVEDSAITDGFYANGITAPAGATWTPQSGAYTHSDAFQFNTGANLEIRHSLLGGTRNAFADRVSVPYRPGGATGRDYGNSSLMWQQEGNAYGPAGWIDNVDVHDVWLGGGAGTVQLVTKNANAFPAATNHLRRAKVMTRQPGWGTTSTSPGYALVRSADIALDISDVVWWDGTNEGRDGTGVACPVDTW